MTKRGKDETEIKDEEKGLHLLKSHHSRSGLGSGLTEATMSEFVCGSRNSKHVMRVKIY